MRKVSWILMVVAILLAITFTALAVHGIEGRVRVRAIIVQAQEDAPTQVEPPAPPVGSPYKWRFYSGGWHCLVIKSWREVFNIVK